VPIRGDWKFPTASGIVTTPTLRPDHSILCAPGYDPTTRLYLVADPTLILPAIPAFPTREQAGTALELLDALLNGFPFVTEIDRSVALSALLTTVCRGAMSVAPLPPST
jgi:putative DNA primase/helicase